MVPATLGTSGWLAKVAKWWSDSVAEFTLVPGGADHYDVSLVDGTYP